MLFRYLHFSIDQQQRVYGLDFLRALAILFVVIEHSIVILSPLPLPLNKIFWSFGFWGVELFFVLSGFLIGSIIIKQFDREGFSWSGVLHFWRRRWFRTLPNYYLFLIVNIFVGWLIWDRFEFNYLQYGLFLQNIYGPHPSFFGEAWTLALEEWFYLLLPVLYYLFGALYPKGGQKRVLLRVVGFVILLSILLRYFQFVRFPAVDLGTWDSFFRKIVFLRFDSIMFGVLGAYIMYHHRRFWDKYKDTLFVPGMAIILLNYLFSRIFIETGDSGPFSKTVYFTSCGLGLLMILPRCFEMRMPRSWVFKAITLISVLSYSMYLIHYSFLLKLFMVYFTANRILDAIGVYFLYWFVLMAIALVVYKYYERPIMDLRDDPNRDLGQAGLARRNT